MIDVLKIYTYVDGVDDTPFPSAEKQIEIIDFTYSAQRMGSVELAASVMLDQCYDELWTKKEYVTFQGEKYFIVDTPSSTKDNKDVRYKHDIIFRPSREMLNSVYFFDVVSGEQYASNNTNVIFFGDINQLVGRLNASMTYSNVPYSIVVDEDITTEDKQLSFSDQFIFQVLQTAYNEFEIPFYFVGTVIHFGYTSNTITEEFEYGINNNLLSVSKTNANYKIITRCTGIGSGTNIPFYYPNPSNDRESIESNGGTWITPSKNLMPPIYRDSLGLNRFYNAMNNSYINPDTEEYYEFENLFVPNSPKEHKASFDDIKPTIKGIKNNREQRIDQLAAVAFDENDNDKVDSEGRFEHPYFFVKLNRFNGEYGFNLFGQSIVGSDMYIEMTSGNCTSCRFMIGVTEEEQKNIVQVDLKGNLLRDENGNVVVSGIGQERQNDTVNNDVWLALAKDDSTFDITLPNVGANYKPAMGDTFVLTGIDMPQSYIDDAESRLENEIIKYMYENNMEKFNFSIDFSRIYLAENPLVYAQLNENARILVKYNDNIKSLYINSYTYEQKGSDALPHISVEVGDVINVGKNSIQTSIDNVKREIMSSVGSVDFYKQGLKYFIRKDINDYANGNVTFNKGLKTNDNLDLGSYVGGFVGGVGGRFTESGNGFLQKLTVYDELIVPKITFNCLDVTVGDSASSFSIGIIKSVDTGNKIAELDLLSDEYGTPHLDDINRGIFHRLESNTGDGASDSNGFLTYTGFSTSYFTITKIITNTAGTFKFNYALQSGTTTHPTAGMKFFSYGNFTDTSRQSITYRTKSYDRILKNVSTWRINPDVNIVYQSGDLEGLTIGGMEMHGIGTYQSNSYLSGVQIQFTPTQFDALKGKSAYNVSLSSDGCVLRLDANGNLLDSLSGTYDVTSGNDNVYTGDSNVTTQLSKLTFTIQAYRGATELFYATNYRAGGFIVSYTTKNCSAYCNNGAMYISNVTDYTNASVEVIVNCEGEAVYRKVYTITGIKNGTQGKTNVTLYKVSKLLPTQLPSRNYISTSDDSSHIYHFQLQNWTFARPNNKMIEIYSSDGDGVFVDYGNYSYRLYGGESSYTSRKILYFDTKLTNQIVNYTYNAVNNGIASFVVTLDSSINLSSSTSINIPVVGRHYITLEVSGGVASTSYMDFAITNADFSVYATWETSKLMMEVGSGSNTYYTDDTYTNWPTPINIDNVSELYSLDSDVATIGYNSLGTIVPSHFTVKQLRNLALDSTYYLTVFYTNDGLTFNKFANTGNRVSSISITPVSGMISIECYLTDASTSKIPTTYIQKKTIAVINKPDIDVQGTNSVLRKRGYYTAGDITTQYFWSDEYRDWVIYQVDNDAQMWMVNTFTGSDNGITGKPSLANGWIQANKECFTAIDTALIDGANIAGFNFKNNKMISGKGIVTRNSEDIIIDLSDLQSGESYDPLLTIDGKNGIIRYNGHVEAPFKTMCKLSDLQSTTCFNWNITDSSFFDGTLMGTTGGRSGAIINMFNATSVDIVIYPTLINPSYTTSSSKVLAIYVTIPAYMMCRLLIVPISGTGDAIIDANGAAFYLLNNYTITSTSSGVIRTLTIK